MNAQRVDSVIAYALAIAGEADEVVERELGPIHLVKYVYLADLAHSSKHAGETFTGANWTFYNFGPWDAAVFARIDAVVVRLGADEVRVPSQYEGDFVRYKLTHGDTRAFAKELPLGVEMSVRRAVHDFGKNTSELLSYVYRTPPMLRAAPNERLDFAVVGEPRDEEYVKAATVPHEVSTQVASPRKLEKRRAKATEGLRERVRARLAEKRSARGRCSAEPSPRYDEVFEQGVKWLDSLGGEEEMPEAIEAKFSAEVWRSRGRADTEVS